MQASQFLSNSLYYLYLEHLAKDFKHEAVDTSDEDVDEDDGMGSDGIPRGSA